MRYRFWLQWKDYDPTDTSIFNNHQEKTFMEAAAGFDLDGVKALGGRTIRLAESGMFAGAFNYVLYDSCTYNYLSISDLIERETNVAKKYLETRNLDDLFEGN